MTGRSWTLQQQMGGQCTAWCQLYLQSKPSSHIVLCACVCVCVDAEYLPVHKGQVNSSCDIGGGENQDIRKSFDVVNLGEECINHSDGIWGLATWHGRLSCRCQALYLQCMCYVLPHSSVANTPSGSLTSSMRMHTKASGSSISSWILANIFCTSFPLYSKHSSRSEIHLCCYTRCYCPMLGWLSILVKRPEVVIISFYQVIWQHWFCGIALRWLSIKWTFLSHLTSTA